MYRNQFLLVKGYSEKQIEDFSKANHMGLIIYTQNSLNMAYVKDENKELILLGFIIDPFSPMLSDAEVLNHIAKNCKDKDDFLNKIQQYSGRFVFYLKIIKTS